MRQIETDFNHDIVWPLLYQQMHLQVKGYLRIPRLLSRPKSKKHLKYPASNILYMTNMLEAFLG